MSDGLKHAGSGFMPNRSLPLGLLAALALSLSAPALAADSVKIDDLVVAATIPDAQREATLKAVAPSTISGTPATKPC
jgi:hypothetical protein